MAKTAELHVLSNRFPIRGLHVATRLFLLGGKMCTLNGQVINRIPIRGLHVAAWVFLFDVYTLNGQDSRLYLLINRFPIRGLHVATRVPPCTLPSVLGDVSVSNLLCTKSHVHPRGLILHGITRDDGELWIESRTRCAYIPMV
ncbi:hypothetical protein BHM03_00055798 [Ensete ventricosum]|nr:hypothetical protein BHM03_00055798 [Ensete ventricosum]